jgi:hypothetical protein
MTRDDALTPDAPVWSWPAPHGHMWQIREWKRAGRLRGRYELTLIAADGRHVGKTLRFRRQSDAVGTAMEPFGLLWLPWEQG